LATATKRVRPINAKLLLNMSSLVESEKLPTAELAESSRAADHDDDDSWNEYRPLSMLAVVSLVVSLVSLIAFVDPLLASVSILALLLAFWAWRNTRANRDEIRGAGLATAALVIALVATFGSVTLHAYEYATELRPGESRLGFAQLQQDERDIAAWEESLKQLNGKQVLIKGYALAGNQNRNINTFILCADKGDCCFGGNPKITDRVLIKLDDTAGIDYTDRLQKFAGTFHYKPTKNAVDVSNGGDVWYILEGAAKR
jgi:hypothetical protein